MITNTNKNTCITYGCMKLPNYNSPSQTKALYCNDHKQENMINVKCKRCIHDGCTTIPYYNIITEIEGDIPEEAALASGIWDSVGSSYWTSRSSTLEGGLA
jgi:hypothetical protein